MPNVETIDPPALGKPNPLYAAMTAAKISSTTTLYTISGQVAEDPSTGAVPDGLPAQVALCLKRMDICLEHIGAEKGDMARFIYYIRQGAIDDHDASEGAGSALKVIVAIVGEWLAGHRPASCYMRSFGMTEDKFACEFEATVILSKE